MPIEPFIHYSTMAKKTQKQFQNKPAARKQAPVPTRRKDKQDSLFSAGKEEFIFGRQNFIWIGIGLALVCLGLLAMAGGAMPDPNTWDPDIIYSFRRITLAPILMVAGFVVVIYGIFKKTNTEATAQPDNTPAE